MTEIFENKNDVTRALQIIRSIVEKTAISSHRLRTVFLDNARQGSDGVRLRRGMDLFSFNQAVNEYLVAQSGELTNENVSDRGKLVIESSAQPLRRKVGETIRISQSRRQ